jgi:hypothetical protein
VIFYLNYLLKGSICALIVALNLNELNDIGMNEYIDMNDNI